MYKYPYDPLMMTVGKYEQGGRLKGLLKRGSGWESGRRSDGKMRRVR